ncbi:MAG: efflux RND transporter permease subunit, partial [Candidatus Aminicenantes bacterium]|nr:efflux RND transporter permease subunit [Candidatus Aminicenantes bacterium]
MIEKIVRFSLRQRIFILLATVLLGALGFVAYRSLAIDVFPDPSPPLVQVYTEAHGMAPEEIERLVSYPLESAMFGLPRVRNIRSISSYALSIVNVYFEDKTDIYWARQLVSQRILEARDQLPEQATNPVLGPIATGLGMVYLYVLEGEGHSTMELRTLQDWLVKYELKSVPEVSQVLSIGGEVRQFQILVDPQALLKYGLSLANLIDRVRRNNQNAGASFITRGPEEFIVHSVGLARTVEDLESIVLATAQGTPVKLRDVAEVRVAPAVRRGAALADGQGEKVVGIVLKLFGSNTAKVIAGLEERIAEINRSLPAGVKIVPFYNQASLVRQCFSTVSVNLALGIALVVLVLFLFMGDFRSAAVAVLSLPFSILFSFLLMNRAGLAADLISFGGLAIAIGLIADASIIFVENAHRHLRMECEDKARAILTAAEEVGQPLFFAIFIIIIVFLPIFTLTGMEGIMFRPLGFVISFSLAGSLLFALVAAPVLAFFFQKSSLVACVEEPGLIRRIKKIYLPFFALCRRHRRAVFAVTLTVFAAGLAVLPFTGREYIPYLEEGTLHLRVTYDPNIALDQVIARTTAIEKVLLAVPEVTGVLSRIGRGEVGSHAHFINDAEILVRLTPARKWKAFRNKDELIRRIEHDLEGFPGINLAVTQPIAHNLDELLTGVKAQLAVKVYGEDFDILKRLAGEILEVVGSVRGAADVQVEQFTGQNHLRIVLDRQRISRYGIDIGVIQDTIEAAVGGITLGQVYEEQKRFDIFLRYRPESRSGVEELRNLYIPLPGGGQIPLAQLAAVEEVVGPRSISREANKRFITIQSNIRGRDIGSFVREAQDALREKVKPPAGYFIKWSGQFELQQRASRQLNLITPLTLALVALLLFTVFRSTREVAIILINIPLALTGGILALKLSGQYLSVPTSIGFIAIFGIALEDGLVLMSAFNRNLKSGRSLVEAVDQGISTKLRPVLMTSFTTVFGILPLLLARGPGAEIQRPLATVVVGGLLTSTLVTLVVLPLVYETVKRKSCP